MKAKYFRKIRKQVKWYKVSHRDGLLDSFVNEKEILAKSPENACWRYHKRTGAFINKWNPNYITQHSECFSRFKVCIGQKVMYFD
nr:MAG TPA: hypothetical protein [Siphoviridae sp. ctDlU28]